jgi:hypothetical protein
VRPRLITTIDLPSNVTDTEEAEQTAVRLYGDGFVAARAGTIKSAVNATRRPSRIARSVPPERRSQKPPGCARSAKASPSLPPHGARRVIRKAAA